MKLLAKVGWALLGLLLLGCLGLMFWINWVLGAVFAVFMGLVLWWVFGIIKRKTDLKVAQAAKKLGLNLRSHPFRYAGMHGEYNGRAVRISYESQRRAGLGSLLATQGGPPGMVALDMQDITLVRMEHGLAAMARELLDPGPPPILAHKQELRLVLEGVCTDPRLLKEALRALEAQVKSLAAEKGA